MPRPRYHLLGSLAVGGVLYAFSGDVRRVAVALTSGFLVDLDHFVDYTVSGHTRIVLPLHAWELVPPLALADRASRLGGALVGAYTLHLLMDQIWNEKRSWMGFFILYRARHGFAADVIGARNPAVRHAWRSTPLRRLARWF